MGETMVKFAYLNKAEKDQWLPQLFDLLYENMSQITPTGLSYEEEKAQWFSNVSPALDKAPRQVLMGFVDDELACYIQYYIREDLLMVEEVQIRKRYQGGLLFLRLCRRLMAAVPDGVRVVEAYADRRNLNSQKLMRKLGMVPVPEEADAPFVHMRGIADDARRHFLR